MCISTTRVVKTNGGLHEGYHRCDARWANHTYHSDEPRADAADSGDDAEDEGTEEDDNEDDDDEENEDPSIFIALLVLPFLFVSIRCPRRDLSQAEREEQHYRGEGRRAKRAKHKTKFKGFKRFYKLK